MADGDDAAAGQRTLATLTTEHFTLQGARASTISESTARANIFVFALSSTLVAMGFIGQVTDVGDAFRIFALVVLPTLYALGVFTFVRLVESSVEDLYYGRAVNRIRSYYQRELGDDARYLLLGGHDDVRGVLNNMGMPRPSRWQLYFTLATMVAVLDAVVGGSAVAFLAGVLGVATWLAVVLGAVASSVSAVSMVRWQARFHRSAGDTTETLFPSPAS
jgi:hypothetical protein